MQHLDIADVTEGGDSNESDGSIVKVLRLIESGGYKVKLTIIH